MAGSSTTNTRRTSPKRNQTRFVVRRERKMSELLESDTTDRGVILVRFNQAISVVVVCQRSLAAQESAAAGDDEETLSYAIRMLRDVYNEFDLACGTEAPRGG